MELLGETRAPQGEWQLREEGETHDLMTWSPRSHVTHSGDRRGHLREQWLCGTLLPGQETG